MKNKRLAAGLLALAFVFGGAVSNGAPVISQTITAQAEAVTEAECYSFDEETGVLTIRGEIDADEIKELGYKDNVKSIIAEDSAVFPANCRNLFEKYYNCTSIDLSAADTSNVTNMGFMFWRCAALTKLDLSSFNTSNVTNMSHMFWECSALTEIDLSGFDTSNVTDMCAMFSDCRKLTTLDLSGFDTSKVEYMQGMFSGCKSLTSLDLSSFDTSNVTEMDYMFKNCSALTSLDLSEFNTGKIKYMDGIFSGCKSLTSLDLSGFDTSNVKQMNYMFKDCNALTSLDLSSFDTSNARLVNDMFVGCYSLKDFILGEKYSNITEKAKLPIGNGWVNAKRPSVIVSGSGNYAVIENDGRNIYKQYEAITYPTNIKVAYSEKYRQVRFTWDRVEGADRYGIAVYLAGKWRVQTQNITDTTYTTPKNLTPGKTYKVAVAARVNGKWDTANAIKNAVTVTIK